MHLKEFDNEISMRSFYIRLIITAECSPKLIYSMIICQK